MLLNVFSLNFYRHMLVNQKKLRSCEVVDMADQKKNFCSAKDEELQFFGHVIMVDKRHKAGRAPIDLVEETFKSSLTFLVCGVWRIPARRFDLLLDAPATPHQWAPDLRERPDVYLPGLKDQENWNKRLISRAYNKKLGDYRLNT